MTPRVMKYRRPRPATSLGDYVALRTVEDAAGCLLWAGHIRRDGYGWVKSKWGRGLAHVVVYELTHGPVPPGLELDHLCRVKACVRHLEAVTHAENLRRGNSPTAINGRKSKCVRGHALDGRNSRGGRRCLTCHREDARRRAARARAS